MTSVAFIGLGRMGHGMAGRYLDCRLILADWNRSKANAEDLIARGARWARSPADAAEGTDAVVTMVADDAASRAVLLGAAQAGLDSTLCAQALPSVWVASLQLVGDAKRMGPRDFSAASCTPSLRHKDAACALRLAETLLPGVPVSRAALAAYEAAKAIGP